MASTSDDIELQHTEPASQPAIELGQTPDDSSATEPQGGIPEANTEDGGVRGSSSLPWKIPSIEELRKEFRETYTQAEKDRALEKTAEVIKQYSDEMVKRWKEEIDTLLVYAGLFSAILTAFNVQSYLLLQPSTPDPTLAVLQQISLQLNSFSVNPPGALVNSTHPVTPFAPIPMAPVETWAVWLNSLWFSALICSLASASIGILVKQWLHEYEAGISGTSVEIARLRQYRLNHLAKWRVAEIIAILPVLLQVSLVLFLAGLLVLLWHLHATVAIIVSALIGVLLLFVVVTTVMPIFWRGCCYLTPLTYALFRVVKPIKFLVSSLRKGPLIKALYDHCQYLSNLERLPTFIRSWCRRLRDWALRQSWTRVTGPTWRGREQIAVQFWPDSKLKLDVDMIVQAYSTTIDVNHLSDTAGAILVDKDADAVIGCLDRVAVINEQHFGFKHLPMRSADFWTGVLIHAPGKEVFDTLTNTLFMSNERYRDNMSVGHYHRLLLALAATVANPDAGSDAHTASLRLFNILFTFNPTILEVMPWKVVRHVAAATEMWLPQLLYPSDDGPASYLNWSTILDSLSILVRCCSAPVPSWTWSQEETKAFTECIMDFFRKLSLSIPTARRLWSLWNARKLLAILDLVLTYLSEFEDARRWAPRDLLEAVAESVAYVEASRAFESYLDLEDSDEDDVLEGLKKVKHNLEKCRSLELGVGSDEERIQDPLPDLKPDTGAMSVHSAGE